MCWCVCLNADSVLSVPSVRPALMCIVKPEGPPQLCKTDEIGEIVINSRAGGNMYYGLPGVTKNTFEVWTISQTPPHPALTSPQPCSLLQMIQPY